MPPRPVADRAERLPERGAAGRLRPRAPRARGAPRRAVRPARRRMRGRREPAPATRRGCAAKAARAAAASPSRFASSPRLVAASVYAGTIASARSNAARASARRPSRSSAMPRLLCACAKSGLIATARSSAASASSARPAASSAKPRLPCAIALFGTTSTPRARRVRAAGDVASRERQHPGIDQHGRVARRLRQELRVDRLGVIEPPGLGQLDGTGERPQRGAGRRLRRGGKGGIVGHDGGRGSASGDVSKRDRVPCRRLRRWRLSARACSRARRAVRLR